ncbi:MAG: aldehyde dehydrogenase family protein [Calditrichaeota bacterium]|nr:aldehyde dehydrogenase family protein [Calditrichota bacterium]
MTEVIEKISKDTLATLTRDIERVFAAQMENRYSIAATTAKQRIVKLKRLLDAIYRRREDIRRALHQDFKKPAAEVDISEIFAVTQEIKHTIKHLKRWMKPQRVKPTLTMMTTRSHIRYEPKGVVLIIAPWNYPFNLIFGPLAAAIAAGNCAILKPSEFTPHTSALMKEMVNDMFPENEVALFEGDKQVAEILLRRPFHHIFFTGSPAVGRIIMRAAAEHLTTVTLELGGKSPVIIDESAAIKDAAEKLAAEKFFNAGQTCIAPDYIFVHQRHHEAFLKLLEQQIRSAYGQNPAEREASPYFARVINPEHFRRLSDMVEQALEKGARMVVGGKFNPEDNYIAPTVLTDLPEDTPLLQEEIFGPVLPVMPYEDLSTVLQFINGHPKPLALYIFSRRRKNIERIFANTSAGGSCINDSAVQFLHPNLPFGGINNSGFGNSHGFYGFRAFSHERAVLKQSIYSPFKLLSPPYTPRVQRLIDLVVKYL